jgi:hyaluronan synthase
VSGRHKSGSRRRGPHSDSAINNVQDLPDLTYYVMSEAGEDPADEPSPADWNRDRVGDLDRRDPDIRYRRSHVLAARKIAPGALRDSYDIPEVTFSRKEGRGLLLTTMLVAGWVSWHLGYQSLVLLACTAPATVFRALSFVLSWFDKPVETTLAGQQRMDRLHVTVAVPVYNEDPGLLDRCIFAMVNQSRPAQLIWVVDDGSMTDYSAVARHWVGVWPNGTEVRWSRQPNQGKRRAHAVVFELVPEADIFVTVDSDTTLERRALEEGLKPFQSRKVMSVAGIEMGFNANPNVLTRLQSSLQLYAQAVIGAAWSVAGDMYTNRGPFALYRAAMVREFLPVYRDETFFGRRVILGDDSLLALCASARGRSVQQLSAFGLTMWPERLGHHLRQRVRWARGRAVRNFWRIRYRPIWSYCWWFTTSGIHGFLLSGALIALLTGLWPISADVIARAALVLLIMSVPNGLRTLCFRRSDERRRDRLLLVLIRPLAALWSGVVLARIVRLVLQRQPVTFSSAVVVAAPGGGLVDPAPV